jgi:hypothetical protein
VLSRSRAKRAHTKNNKPRPLLTCSWMTKKAVLDLDIDDELLFRERTLEASKFIVGLSYQLIISNNSCH